MTKIYVVVAYGGEWDDAWQRNVKAFHTKEKADEFVLAEQAGQETDSLFFEKLVYRIDRYCVYSADKEAKFQGLSHCSEWNLYCNKVNKMMEKLRDKYPDYSDRSIHYRIDEIELEDEE